MYKPALSFTSLHSQDNTYSARYTASQLECISAMFITMFSIKHAQTSRQGYSTIAGRWGISTLLKSVVSSVVESRYHVHSVLWSVENILGVAKILLLTKLTISGRHVYR